MSKFKVKVDISFFMTVEALDVKQAIDIAKENFEVEDYVDELDENVKFTKAILIDTEEDETEFIPEYNDDLSDDEEDDNY